MKKIMKRASIQPDDFDNAIAIIGYVAKRCNVGVNDLKGFSRQMEIVKARHIAMYALWVTMNFSYMKIGSFFCRDHATVLHAITSVQNQSETNENYRKQVDEIMDKVMTMCPATIIEENEECFQENDFYTN
jgi:chromosomal replication initiation ATPase DnaA